jgi:hypothetical protein
MQKIIGMRLKGSNAVEALREEMGEWENGKIRKRMSVFVGR